MNFWKQIKTRLQWLRRKRNQLIAQAKEMLAEAKKIPEQPPAKKLQRLVIRILEILSMIRLILQLLRENWKDSGKN